MNELYIGNVASPLFYFTDASLISINGETAVDLIGDELSIDTLTPTAQYKF